MQLYDAYRHFKGGKYYFYKIALPLNEMQGLNVTNFTMANDAHSEGDTIQRVEVSHTNGVLFVNKDKPHVVYQKEEDYYNDIWWVREVDDFFGYKEHEDGSYEKKFTLLDKNESIWHNQ